jgi:charged multivesicular body protein 6
LVEVSVLHGLKQGNEVLKELHKEMNVESVEKLLEETHEAREYQRVTVVLVLCQTCLNASNLIAGNERDALK